MTPPAIGTVDGTVSSGGHVTFTVTHPGHRRDAARPCCTWRAAARPGRPGRRSLSARPTADTPSPGPPPWVTDPTVEQYFVQLVDDANNVSVSSKKGQDFAAPATPADSGAPSILLSGTPVDGRVRRSAAGRDHRRGPDQLHASTDGPDADYTGAVRRRRRRRPHRRRRPAPAGTSTPDVHDRRRRPAPTVTHHEPVGVGSLHRRAARSPRSSAATATRSSAARASPATPSTSIGTHTFSVTARDRRRAPTSATVHLRRASYGVRRDAAARRRRRRPDAERLQEGLHGPAEVPARHRQRAAVVRTPASALAASCGVTVSYHGRRAATTAPVDESVVHRGGRLRRLLPLRRRDRQFIYNFGTKSLTRGPVYRLRIYFGHRGVIADHTVKIGHPLSRPSADCRRSRVVPRSGTAVESLGDNDRSPVGRPGPRRPRRPRHHRLRRLAPTVPARTARRRPGRRRGAHRHLGDPVDQDLGQGLGDRPGDPDDRPDHAGGPGHPGQGPRPVRQGAAS